MVGSVAMVRFPLGTMHSTFRRGSSSSCKNRGDDGAITGKCQFNFADIPRREPAKFRMFVAKEFCFSALLASDDVDVKWPFSILVRDLKEGCDLVEG